MKIFSNRNISIALLKTISPLIDDAEEKKTVEFCSHYRYCVIDNQLTVRLQSFVAKPLMKSSIH